MKLTILTKAIKNARLFISIYDFVPRISLQDQFFKGPQTFPFLFLIRIYFAAVTKPPFLPHVHFNLFHREGTLMSKKEMLSTQPCLKLKPHSKIPIHLAADFFSSSSFSCLCCAFPILFRPVSPLNLQIFYLHIYCRNLCNDVMVIVLSVPRVVFGAGNEQTVSVKGEFHIKLCKKNKKCEEKICEHVSILCIGKFCYSFFCKSVSSPIYIYLKAIESNKKRKEFIRPLFGLEEKDKGMQVR